MHQLICLPSMAGSCLSTGSGPGTARDRPGTAREARMKGSEADSLESESYRKALVDSY